MLTKFFSTSKPVNLLVVLLLGTIFFWIAQLKPLSKGVEVFVIAKTVLGYLMYLAIIFMVQFIVHKNELTKPNSYSILVFTTISGVLPFALTSFSILFSSLLLLFALRRLLSIRTGTAVPYKIFDAAVLITVIAQIHSWNSTYLLLCFCAIIYFGYVQFRYWVLPIIGVLTVSILIFAYALWEDNLVILIPQFLTDYGFTGVLKSNLKPILICYGVFLALCLPWYVKRTSDSLPSLKPGMLMVISLLAISVITLFSSDNKFETALFFLSFPATIVLSTFIQELKNKYLKEAAIILTLIVPLVLMAFR